MFLCPRRLARAVSPLLLCGLVSACSDEFVDTEPEELSDFSLNFAAVYNGAIVECGDRMMGLGTSGTAEAEMSDLRFYVSGLTFYDANGNSVPVELDENEFQYSSPEGKVAMIDLTDTSAGACAGEGLGFPEGTARMNSVITGRTNPDRVEMISFDVGIPQPLMRQVILNNTAEDAPSPLREMHWSWAFAYRQFVLNFTISEGGVAGEGYLHVGSRECGGDGAQAFTDTNECGRPNAAAVMIDSFSLENDTVAIDLGELLNNLDFLVDEGGNMVPGVSCHSGATQPDCAAIFDNLGIEMTDGTGDPALNLVFDKQ